MRVLPLLLLFALPAWADEAALPLTHVDWSVPVGLCLIAPATFAGLNRAKVRA